jgi:hypothetical protein
MKVMRGEENVKGRIVRMEWQLHQQQWDMDDESRHQYQAQRYRPLGRGDGIDSLQGPLSKG